MKRLIAFSSALLLFTVAGATGVAYYYAIRDSALRADAEKALFAWKMLTVMVIFVSGVALLAAAICRQYRRIVSSRSHCLLQAIRAGEITPWYQPVMDSASGQLYGAEVLARWLTPGGTIIPPDVFIPLAERTGLLTDLTVKLLEQVEGDLMVLRLRLPRRFHVSINLSASTVSEMLDSLLRFQERFPGHISLVVELTEREEAIAGDELAAALSLLRNKGVRIALDDFGTGYSNLARLARLPVDIIKVDRLFVRMLSEKGERPFIVDDIIRIAKPRGISLIAEGIETAYQQEFLQARDITLQQGYFWSVPLDARAFTRFIIRR